MRQQQGYRQGQGFSSSTGSVRHGSASTGWGAQGTAAAQGVGHAAVSDTARAPKPGATLFVLLECVEYDTSCAHVIPAPEIACWQFKCSTNGVDGQ